jgi:hypothetical protein
MTVWGPQLIFPKAVVLGSVPGALLHEAVRMECHKMGLGPLHF